MAGKMGASLRKSGPLGQEFDGTEGYDPTDDAMSNNAVAKEFPDHISGTNSTMNNVTGKTSMGTLGARGHGEG